MSTESIASGIGTPLLILYGSQTGNAQDVAERVAREAKQRHFLPRVLAMDAYSLAHLPTEQLVVFVTATAGQGEVPDNMKRLWRLLLRKSLPADALRGVHVAVFGLGDSGYQKYNVVAKKLDRRLVALGADPMLERGLGDDQHPSGYEAALDPWLAQLWRQLRLFTPLPPGVTEPAPDDTRTGLDPKYAIRYLSLAAEPPLGFASDHEEALAAGHEFGTLESGAGAESPPRGPQPEGNGTTNCDASSADYGPGRPFMAGMAANRRLTAAAHFQDVRHIELDLGDSGIAYEPGDLLAIMPRQPGAAVRALLQRLGLEPDALVAVRRAGPTVSGAPGQEISPVRVSALVAGALDVTGASPRRYFFEVLHHFAAAEHERERLQYLSSPGGRDDLYRYNQREGRTVLEVLQDFKSVALPLEWLLQVAPRLQPRLFSIASSLRAHPCSAHVTAAVVSWLTPFKRTRKGVCTSWLASLQPGEDHVPVWVQKGVLRLPPSPATHLLLIGPGTGVAPFRSFLQERQAILLADVNIDVGDSSLYFGCRNEAGDFLYREEWEELQSSGALGSLVTAFSRDQERKVYVTHRLRENGAQVWQLLQQGGVVYVSGSAEKMPQDVSKALEDIAVQQGGMSTADAQVFVRQLELSRRYIVEAWS